MKLHQGNLEMSKEPSQVSDDAKRLDLIFHLLQTEEYAILELGPFEITWNDEIKRFELMILDSEILMESESGREVIDHLMNNYTSGQPEEPKKEERK